MNSQVFMATTGESLIRSEQIGTEKWDTSTVLENIQINCLAVNPLDPSEVYAGTLDGILRSMDAGCNWVAAGMKGYPIKSLSVSPHQPGVVYAGSMPASIYKTEDNGGNWTELKGFQKIRNRWWWFSPADPSFKAYVQAIAISPKDPEIILAGVELGAVVRSQDGGNTWSAHLKGALRDCHSLIFHSTNGNWAYEGGGSGGGASYSQDGGRTWSKPRTGLGRSYGWAVAADPQKPEVWYLSASPQPSLKGPWVPPAHIDGEANAHIFRSVGGAEWEVLTGGLPQPLNYMAYALITNPAKPGHVYAGLSDGDVWHSGDYGDSWDRLSFNLGGIHRDMVMLVR